MSDKNQTTAIIGTVIGTGIAIIFGLGGWVNMSIGEVRSDIRELRMKVDNNAAAIANNAEAIARLEGILIGDNRPVPATTTPPSSDPDKTALN